MLLISILILIIYSSLYNKSYHFNKDINRIGILILLYILYMLIDLLLISINSNYIYIPIYNDLYSINILSIYTSLIIILLSILLLFNSISTIISIKDINNINYYNKNYIIIILYNILGLLLFININNLIALYITIELQSYSIYIITSLYNKSNRALNSGLLYFLIGGIASIILLYGCAIIYNITGVLNMDNIYILIHYNYNIYMGLILILIGLSIKMGMAPLHNWSITVYNNTPTIITAWISIITKLSIMTYLYSMIYNINIYSINSNNNIFIYVLSLIIVSSLIIGAIGGLIQIKIKLIFIYSGILNGAYMLFTLLINNIDALIAFIIFILQYTITHINLFIILLYIPILLYNNNYITNNSNNNNNNNNNNIYTSIYSPIEYIMQLHLLINKNTYITLALLISLFSLIGIPPLYGFYGKLYIIISGISNGYILITILLIICSTISTLYYIYIIKEVSIYNDITTINNNTNITNNNNNNYILYNSNSITYIISSITCIILFNSIQLINIVKGAYIIGITLLTII